MRNSGQSRRGFIGGALASSLGLLAGCRSGSLLGSRRSPRSRIALNASTIRPYGLKLRQQLDLVYANGFRAHVGDEESVGPNGLTFHGSKGDLYVFRGKFEPPKALKSLKESDFRGRDVRLYCNPAANGSHELDFVDAVFTGRPCACPVEVGHRSATVCQIVNIAAHAGRSKVTWGPVREAFTGASADLNDRLVVPYLNGWKLEA